MSTSNVIPGTVITFNKGTLVRKKSVIASPDEPEEREVGHLSDGDAAIIVAVVGRLRGNLRWLIVSENAVGWIKNLIGTENVHETTNHVRAIAARMKRGS